MGNSLLIYLNKRLKEVPTFEKGNELAGPVITISREVGCKGLELARLIANRLNNKNMLSEWKVLSKEIFHQSAKELNLDPEKLRKKLKQTDSYTFEQILKAFNDKNYKSEQKIGRTVKEVVRSLAIDGFCIIVGRAGHIITSDIKNAIHIRLTAPIEYRIKNIMHNNQLNHEEALAFIRKVEKERAAFRKALNENSLQEELFDLTINRASFTNEQVIDLIEYTIQKKGILNGYRQKMEFY